LSMVIVEVCPIYKSAMCPGSDRSRFQLITGEAPFLEYSEATTYLRVLKGKWPAKPRSIVAPGMTPAVWKIANKCWNGEPKERPAADTILCYLEDIVHRGSGVGVSEQRAPGPFGQR